MINSSVIQFLTIICIVVQSALPPHSLSPWPLGLSGSIFIPVYACHCGLGTLRHALFSTVILAASLSPKFLHSHNTNPNLLALAGMFAYTPYELCSNQDLQGCIIRKCKHHLHVHVHVARTVCPCQHVHACSSFLFNQRVHMTTVMFATRNYFLGGKTVAF